MKRFKHSLSHYRLFSGDMGQLIPVGWFEALPGDTVQHQSSMLLRFSPLLAPVMHPVQVRIHHFFVPMRLLWDEWEDFITGDATVVYPTLTVGAGDTASGSLLDYLGIPLLTANTDISPWPVRAYNLVFNEYYRDQDLVSEVAEDSLVLQRCAWQKDYFTSARPWPQKGTAVTIPLSGSDVVGDGSAPTYENPVTLETGGINAKGDTTLDVPWMTPGGGNAGILNWDDPHLQLASSVGINITDLRESLAMQRYQEARAQYGSRYTEYLKYLGVNSADARLQRPEYLGGGKATIAFSEVLQTGPDSSDDGVATMRGHGINALRTRRYRRFFQEHGIVISLMSVRPKTVYTQALDKGWLRRSLEDFWQKEFELIGQQEVLEDEIFGETPSGAVFGYQDRYAEYRHKQSSVAGDFRTSLNFWHLARDLSAAPTLNADFVTCTPADRIFAVPSAQNLWVMMSHSIQARRLVGKRTIGSIR